MNLFPIDMTLSDGRKVGPVRVVSDGTATAVWAAARTARDAGLGDGAADNTGRAILVAYNPQAVPQVDDKSWTLALGDETTAVLDTRGGCGCGHPLKRYTPPMPGSNLAGRHVG